MHIRPLIIALFIYPIVLNAQWKLSPEYTADYECTIGTVDSYEFKAGDKTGFATRNDTLYFTLRRTIVQKADQYAIRYKLLKHLEYGGFRDRKPDVEVEFPTDQSGNLLTEYFRDNAAAEYDDLTGKIHDFLRLTVLPYPKEAMQKGLKWSVPFQYGIRNWKGMTSRSQELRFEVRQTTKKYERDCFKVQVQCGSPAFGRNMTFNGDLFYDAQTGQLVYLELQGTGTIVNFPVNSENMFEGKSRIRLSLLPESTVHSEKTGLYEEAEAERARMTKAYRWVAPPRYHTIEAISWKNLDFGYITSLNGRFGFLDKYGKEVLSPTYKYITSTGKGGVFVLSDDGQWTLYNDAGAIVTDSLTGYDLEGTTRILVRKKGLYLWVGTDGKEYARFEKKDGVEYKALPDDYLLLKKSGLYGVMNIKGEMLIPMIYEDIRMAKDYFNNKPYFLCWKGRQSSLTDDQGLVLDRFEHRLQNPRLFGELIVIEDNYTESAATVRNFRTGKTFVLDCNNPYQVSPDLLVCHKSDPKNGDSDLLLDNKGVIVNQFSRFGSELSQSMDDGASSLEVLRVEVQDGPNKKTGWMDTKGNWIREPGYFVSGLDGFGNFIAFDSSGAFGLLAMNMDTILPFQYRNIKTITPDRFWVVTQNRGQMIINKEGTLSIPFPPGYSLTDKTIIKGKGYLCLSNYSTKKVGLFDDQMREIIKPDFDGIYTTAPYLVPHFIMVKVKGWVGLLQWPD